MTPHRTIAYAFLLLSLASFLNAQTQALEEGVKLFREGRFNDALVKLEEAHRAVPHNPTIENLLGITETKLGNLEEANHHYRDAIRLAPSQAAPHRNLDSICSQPETMSRLRRSYRKRYASIRKTPSATTICCCLRSQRITTFGQLFLDHRQLRA